MNKTSLFIIQEKRKIIATIIVGVVFLYFWMNGPLLHTIEVFNLEEIVTKYSQPLIVGKDGVDKEGELTSFKTIQFEMFTM